MAVWEPVGGVFWSTPPIGRDEGWPYWPAIAVLTVTVIAGFVVTRRIQTMRKQEGWHPRKHMMEIGSALTLVYLVGMLALTWGRITTLGSMPLNEVGDFLAGAFGPVAFLWLVIGLLQQAEGLRVSTEALKIQATELKQSTKALELQAAELRNSVEQQTIMADVAMKQMEAQHVVLQMQLDANDKALMADFLVRTISVGNERGMGMNKIRILNEGAKAADLTMTFEPQIPGAQSINLGEIRAEGSTEFKLLFDPEKCADKGTAHLTYLDAKGIARNQSFLCTLDKQAVEFSFRKIYGNDT